MFGPCLLSAGNYAVAPPKYLVEQIQKMWENYKHNLCEERVKVMTRIHLLKMIIVMLLLLFVHGCYVAPGPYYTDQGYGGPPYVAFDGPPDTIVIPDTYYVYAVPDIQFELYFWDGLWWRLWNNHWYRSRYYDRDWYYYHAVPGFYCHAFTGWRDSYRNRMWHGHRWEYERIPHHRLKTYWKSWKNEKYWDTHKKGSWGVRGYTPRPRKQKQGIIQPKSYKQKQTILQPKKKKEDTRQPDRQKKHFFKKQNEVVQPAKQSQGRQSFQDKKPQPKQHVPGKESRSDQQSRREPSDHKDTQIQQGDSVREKPDSQQHRYRFR